ncbi:tryptophan synthase subunit alpha [Thermodesulfobacteriota bacterium]
MLESYIRSRLNEKDILLMTHIVLGYPSFQENLRAIEVMVEGGVDLMELQIPFSEPIADGPVILRANQKALETGARVQACLDFACEVTRVFDIPFLIMSYYNILYKYGIGRFAALMEERGLRGAIIPDLPPEEGEEYLHALRTHHLAPILIYSPRTSSKRMAYLATFARGFIYCVARKGVTGAATDFSKDITAYLSKCRKATRLPLALGFGVKEKGDLEYLKGKAEIAVVGTETIRVMERGGTEGIADFIGRLLS